MSEHTIKRFEDELNELKAKVLAMGGLVEKATRRAMNSLVKQDSKRAEKVIARDSDINALEIDIDDMTRTILALRQPAAKDLRFVISTIKVVSDLERMGDLAEDIAEQMLATNEHPLIHIASLQDFSELVREQIRITIDAFARDDVNLALTCIANDQLINNRFQSMQREYLTYMLEDTHQISATLIASNIAKNLERISDHTVNIAKMVIYMVNGQDVRHIAHEEIAGLVQHKGTSD